MLYEIPCEVREWTKSEGGGTLYIFYDRSARVGGVFAPAGLCWAGLPVDATWVAKMRKSQFKRLLDAIVNYGWDQFGETPIAISVWDRALDTPLRCVGETGAMVSDVIPVRESSLVAELMEALGIETPPAIEAASIRASDSLAA